MRHLQSFLTDKGHAETQRSWAIWAKKRTAQAHRRHSLAREFNGLGVARTAALGVERNVSRPRWRVKQQCYRGANLGEIISPNFLQPIFARPA